MFLGASIDVQNATEPLLILTMAGSSEKGGHHQLSRIDTKFDVQWDRGALGKRRGGAPSLVMPRSRRSGSTAELVISAEPKLDQY